MTQLIHATPISSPFRSEQNNLLTVALFYETPNVGNYATYADDRSRAIFTLRPDDLTLEDGRVLPSLYRLYMDMEDVNEFEFANRYFESHDHWEKVKKSPVVKPFYRQMRKDLLSKLRTQAYHRILDEAKNGGKNAYQANKFLVEKFFQEDKPKETKKSLSTMKDEDDSYADLVKAFDSLKLSDPE